MGLARDEAVPPVGTIAPRSIMNAPPSQATPAAVLYYDAGLHTSFASRCLSFQRRKTAHAQAMPYDRDAVVSYMTEYYELLIALAYLKESDISRPPPTGWTEYQLLMNMLAPAKRSDSVMDLIKHLPYVHRKGIWKMTIYPEVCAFSYLKEHNSDLADETSEDALQHFHERVMSFEGQVTPAGMIALASDRRADAWLLDVDEGVVYNCDSMLHDEDAPEEEPWRRGGRRCEIKDFFEEIYGHVKSLLIIPVPEPFFYLEGGESAGGEVSRVAFGAVQS